MNFMNRLLVIAMFLTAILHASQQQYNYVQLQQTNVPGVYALSSSSSFGTPDQAYYQPQYMTQGQGIFSVSSPSDLNLLPQYTRTLVHGPANPNNLVTNASAPGVMEELDVEEEDEANTGCRLPRTSNGELHPVLKGLLASVGISIAGAILAVIILLILRSSPHRY